MEFLKEILGEELYKQVEEKITSHNGLDENKEKQIKIGNLGTGEYVGKGKYDADIANIQALLDGKTTELDTANNLISDLKKSNKGNEDLQGKITTYETQVVDLQKQLEETKLNGAIKVALLEAKANDIDYMTFKLKEKGELKLDENEKIEGWEEKLSGLKTQFPKHFEGASDKKIDEKKLPDSDDERKIEPSSLAEAIKQSYEKE